MRLPQLSDGTKKVLLVAALLALPMILVRGYLDRKPAAGGDSPEEISMRNLAAIHMAMSNFARDKGHSPYDFNQVVGAGYMQKLIDDGTIKEFPVNPWTGIHVRQIPFGQPPSAGDFAYLPANESDGAQEHSTGIHLLGYGQKRGHLLTLWLDTDNDGQADPVMHVISKESRAVKGARLEPLEETLKRMGYTKPLDMAMPF